MGLFDKINKLFSSRNRAKEQPDVFPEMDSQNNGDNLVKEEQVWPSYQGFALDANHYSPSDDLTADEWEDIQAEIAVWDEAEGYIDDEPSALDDEKYDPDVITLPSGTILMRYGNEHGTFLTDLGTTIDQCALPLDQYEVNYYVLNEPLEVHAGTARPWFGKEGGGAQYKTLEGKTPLDLLDSRAFSRCDVDGNRLDTIGFPKSADSEIGAYKSFVQAAGEKLKGFISDFAQKHSQEILATCSAVQILTGAAQLKIDIKKIDAEIEPITRIEQMNDAIDAFEEKVADDDIAGALEKSNQESAYFNEVNPSLVAGDSPKDPQSNEGGDPLDNPPLPIDGGGDSLDAPTSNDSGIDLPDKQHEVVGGMFQPSDSFEQMITQTTASEAIVSGDQWLNAGLPESQLFSSYEDRIKHTPSMESGRWAGERGESLCVAKTAKAQDRSFFLAKVSLVLSIMMVYRIFLLCLNLQFNWAI